MHSLGEPEAARLKAARLPKLPPGEPALEREPCCGSNRCWGESAAQSQQMCRACPAPCSRQSARVSAPESGVNNDEQQVHEVHEAGCQGLHAGGHFACIDCWYA